jgi:hypothetical protein
MTILTLKYKYKVLERLLQTKESFEDICSKSGLTITQANKYLNYLKTDQA